MTNLKIVLFDDDTWGVAEITTFLGFTINISCYDEDGTAWHCPELIKKYCKLGNATLALEVKAKIVEKKRKRLLPKYEIMD